MIHFRIDACSRAFLTVFRVKILLASLLCFVLVASQTFALKGGPEFGGNVKTTGTYAGVMIPGALSPGSNSIGLFTLLLPTTGLGSGTVVIFTAGETYTGTIRGSADPDTAKLVGEVSASFPVIEIVPGPPDSNGNSTAVTITVAATAAGSVKGKMKANKNLFSTASVRIVGSADIQFSLTVNNPFDEIIYDVSGFKQAEAQ